MGEIDASSHGPRVDKSREKRFAWSLQLTGVVSFEILNATGQAMASPRDMANTLSVRKFSFRGGHAMVGLLHVEGYGHPGGEPSVFTREVRRWGRVYTVWHRTTR